MICGKGMRACVRTEYSDFDVVRYGNLSDVSFDEYLDPQFVQNNNNDELLGDNERIAK